MGDGLGGASPRTGSFGTTCWSLVLTAGADRGTESREALGVLCQLYWYPVYAYVRRRGHRAGEAEELTQAFFVRLLEHKTVSDADPARGRFRSYLLGALKQFLSNDRDWHDAQKRGGGATVMSLDAADARYALEPVHDQSPERLFDQRWAAALLELVFGELRREYQGGREAMFERLKDCIAGGRGDDSYRELGVALDMSETAVKAAAFRLRRRYRELLRAEIARTVDGASEVEQEIRDLFDAARG
jgi:RNA polymerase sigma-70 factor (ECF subfamily)